MVDPVQAIPAAPEVPVAAAAPVVVAPAEPSRAEKLQAITETLRTSSKLPELQKALADPAINSISQGDNITLLLTGFLVADGKQEQASQLAALMAQDKTELPALVAAVNQPAVAVAAAAGTVELPGTGGATLTGAGAAALPANPENPTPAAVAGAGTITAPDGSTIGTMAAAAAVTPSERVVAIDPKKIAESRVGSMALSA